MDYSALFFIILFITELVLLFYFSKLVSRSFARIFYSLTKNRNLTIYLLAILFLPGTVIHELAHAITAGVLMVHVGSVEFIPQVQDDGVKLGSAQIGQTDPIRRALIGFAPVLVGLLIIFTILFLLASSFKDHLLPFWVYILTIYLLFEISNTMFSSKKDLEGFSVFLVLTFSILAGLYLVGIHEPFVWAQRLLTDSTGQFFKAASLLLLIPIGIDLAAYGLAHLVLRR